ncbi:MAG TPA: hypothetical protein VFY38_03875, partial [Pseudonocardia sp.]|nr:hypothetical protein [Pseudonocardia sp.]
MRHSPDQRPGLVVVDAAAVPAWVRRWSERSGRPVRTRPAEEAADAPRTEDSVLILRPTPMTEHPRIVAALGGLPEDAAVLAQALDAALHLDGGLTLVHGIPVSFGPRSVGLADALRRGEHL